MTERWDSTEALQQSLVQFLMEIIKAPDDEDVARKAAETLHELDQRMARGQSAPCRDIHGQGIGH